MRNRQLSAPTCNARGPLGVGDKKQIKFLRTVNPVAVPLRQEETYNNVRAAGIPVLGRQHTA